MESKKEQRKKALREMEENQFTDETRQLMKSLNKVDWEVYNELLRTNQIIPECKFKSKKSIFFNETENVFMFFNPVLRKLFPCGKFVD